MGLSLVWQIQRWGRGRRGRSNGQFSVLDDQALIGQNCRAILKCYNATCSFTVFRGERPAFRVFFSALTGIISHLAICICICICFHICVNLSGVLQDEVESHQTKAKPARDLASQVSQTKLGRFAGSGKQTKTSTFLPTVNLYALPVAATG